MQPVGSRHKFSPDEDQCLRRLVAEARKSDPAKVDWAAIASKLPMRTARQCRERYRNYLERTPNPVWTHWEDELLRRKVLELGASQNQWTQIAQKFFPYRSNINVKNRWTVLMTRHFRTHRPLLAPPPPPPAPVADMDSDPERYGENTYDGAAAEMMG
jgi:hypothetical protein